MTLLSGFTDVYVGVPSPQTSILWCWVLNPLPCMYLGKLILSCIPTPDFYSHVSAHKHMPACTHLCVMVEEVDRVCFVISPIWPQSLSLPAALSQVLGSQVWTTILGCGIQFLIIYLMCMGILSTYLSVHHLCVWCLMTPEERVSGPLGLEPPCGAGD